MLTVGSDWGAAMYPNMLGRLVVRAVVPVDDLNAEAEGFPCWLPAPAWARTHQVGCSIVLDALAAVYLKDIDMGINSVLDAVYDLVAALGNVTANACMVVTRPPCFCWKTWSSNNRMRRPHSLAIILYTKRFRCFLSNTYCPRCQASREGGREIERERERESENESSLFSPFYVLLCNLFDSSLALRLTALLGSSSATRRADFSAAGHCQSSSAWASS